MDEPKRKEEDTLSEAGKRNAAGFAQTIAAQPTANKAPETLRIERPRRRKQNKSTQVDEQPIVVDVPRDDVQIVENPVSTSITPLTGTKIPASGTDSEPVPSSSLLPLSDRIPLSNPERWDRYEILGLLGKGGMGSVFEARDKRIDRRVALKFIHTVDSYMTSRFLQEARAQARIDHPNVCKVLEVGEVEGRVYIAMQLIHGQQLSQAAESMSLEDKVRIMKTVTEAVDAAHRLGVIHRDIKPANIMVEKIALANGSFKSNPILMDFGLAREDSGTQGLTESGALLGTPGYMSPEQARGQARGTDARTDVYGLGATLYDLLTGTPPFVDVNVMNVVLKVLIEDPVPLRVKNPEIPQALETIVIKCLAKEPHRRYASAVDLADDLERYLSREKVLARRLSLPERLYWRGKRNKPMAFAVLALVVSLFAFTGYGVNTAIATARQEQIAQKRAELGKKLGEAVKDLDWLVRTAHLVPLHDTTAEKAIVRARMAGIEAEMRSFADLGAGFDHYALGRGHLALEEWDLARKELEVARARGIQEPELDYGLGRALGELYIRALEDARKSGDAPYLAKRKEELDAEYLAPALAHLERCRGLPTVSANYLEGLIHFYHRRDDEALEQAGIALRTTPWLYEAAKLAGDVYLARALDAKDRGDNDKAERDFGEAVVHYEQAADIGRSDHQVYEALAEAWIRQEEMDLYRGRDPKPKLAKALVAADKSLVAAPKESNGYTKSAFAYYFAAQYAQGHGAPREDVERLFGAQIAAGERAVARHPEHAYGHEITGLAYVKLAEGFLDAGKPVDALLDKAQTYLDDAIRIQPNFPWAYNDYGLALGYAGYGKRKRNEECQPLFEKAIDMTRKATTLDKDYVLAYNNTSAWLTELAQWASDHGQSPEAYAGDAVKEAEAAIRINPKNPLAYANAGLALANIAAYRLDAGEDGREVARKSVGRYREALAIDPDFVFVHRELARANRWLAAHERAQNADPRASIEDAFRALEMCYRVDPGNVDCLLVEAQVKAGNAEWKQSQGEDPVPMLEAAQRLAMEVTRKVPTREDTWIVLGEICLHDADALVAAKETKTKVEPVVKEGIRAILQALTLAPGFPRALAIDGALAAHKAQMDTTERKATLERAQKSFHGAFEGNSLLKKRYGRVADEVNELLRAR